MTRYGDAALRLLENGYLPLPIVPGEKRPAPMRWSSTSIDAAVVGHWTNAYPEHGIGLRAGTLVAVDIDLLDPDLAHHFDCLARERLGDTLVRVGRWPKRLRLYRTEVPFAKMRAGSVEILGLGQQLVAFGIHPDTRQPYYWPFGETPLDVPLERLPLVDTEACGRFLGEIAAVSPGRASRRAHRKSSQPAEPVRAEGGRIVDGRDGWLSAIAYHVVHDALDAGQPLHRTRLAAVVWERFAATADLTRPARHGAGYALADAERKVADKLRLLADNRLPARSAPAPDARYRPPDLGAAAARQRLDRLLASACSRIEDHLGNPGPAPPRIGVRATVGLGKTTLARKHLLALRDRLVAADLPARLLLLTPSLALAEEAATAWRAEGLRVAVLRGYEAGDPATGAPMCQDLAAVRTAVEARLDVHETACASAGRRCRFFEDCSKQRNRDEVAKAEVVVAAHQALYSGFAVDAGSFAAMIIDEGFWASALQEDRRFDLETLAHELLDRSLGRQEGAVADLHDLRRRAVTAFADVGPVSRTALSRAGLNAEACRLAAGLEARRIRRPGLYPGMPLCDRKQAAARVAVNARTHDLIGLWNAMADLAEGTAEHDGRLLRTSGNEVVVSGLRAIHPTLRDQPILHLDATLRPGLALRVLPGLEVVEAEAAMPHMELHLVAGSFGKGVLCPDPALSATEAQRRANRLEEVVTYVRWLARRLSPVLVVTYKDCEHVFAGIPGVSTGHFNAIAGLDGYRDVRLLVVVGRPLPSDLALAPLSRALFGHQPAGGYTTRLGGIRMRDGSSRAVRVAAHEDETAEIIRAAISDDEVLQAIGRGRGVNRTARNPLEVHVLADVALPLVHDRLLAWEAVRPDLFQRMLLAGMAVDSPGDALLLHPGFFPGSAAAEKAFQREGFGGHFPIRDLYREMSVKSAAYRRLGRGRSWQRAWWIDGDDKTAIERLEAALGHLAVWRDDG